MVLGNLQTLLLKRVTVFCVYALELILIVLTDIFFQFLSKFVESLNSWLDDNDFLEEIPTELCN